MHVFPYSVRPGTSAAHFGDRVDPVTKGQRMDLLLDLARDHAADFLRCLLGQVRPVLWEERVQDGGQWLWSGLTDNYVRVYSDDTRQLGNVITETRLLEMQGPHLIGRAGLATNTSSVVGAPAESKPHRLTGRRVIPPLRFSRYPALSSQPCPKITSQPSFAACSSISRFISRVSSGYWSWAAM